MPNQETNVAAFREELDGIHVLIALCDGLDERAYWRWEVWERLPAGRHSHHSDGRATSPAAARMAACENLAARGPLAVAGPVPIIPGGERR